MPFRHRLHRPDPRPLVAALAALSTPVLAAGLSDPASDPAARERNRISVTPAGVSLENPRHLARLEPDGLHFAPAGGDVAWRWSLEAVEVGGAPLPLEEGPPVPDGVLALARDRGALVERYLAHASSVEQRFVLERSLGEGDLVIRGQVASDGRFAPQGGGWRWRGERSEVTLGTVRAFDAAGRELAATMEVTAAATRVRVAGADLARAAYPVVVDPQIGANDFRISETDVGTLTFGASGAVAYNPDRNELLVVWGDYLGARGVYGQRLDAATGLEVGAGDFPIRLVDDDPQDASVVYNPAHQQYLVAWREQGGAWVQRLDAGNGALLGARRQVSDASMVVYGLALALDTAADEYLVAWVGVDPDNPQLAGGETEVYSQWLDGAEAFEVGYNDLRVSDMGPDGTASYGVATVAVTANPQSGELLVVWSGSDDTGGLVSGEREIFGQRLAAATRLETGPNDFRISDLGGTGNGAFIAAYPSVAWSSARNEYLVVWQGDDNVGGYVDDDYEVFGQRLSASGAEVGGNDFPISSMGGIGDPAGRVYGALDVAYSPADDDYVVVWAGDRDAFPLADGLEVHLQRVDGSTGAQVGVNDERLTDVGGLSGTVYDAYVPALAWGATGNQFLVVYLADDPDAGLADGHFEVFGQRWFNDQLLADGFESGTTGGWSATVP